MEKSVNTMRGGGIKRIAALVMSGFIALSGAQLVNSASAQAQEAPYNPIAAYTGYNVVSFGDLHIKAESEGAVAVGGKFSFDGSQTIIKKPAPAALVVKGGVDWAKSTGTHQVNGSEHVNGGPLSINLEGSKALDKDSNGADVQIQVVEEGKKYGEQPNIQLNNNGPKADSVPYDAAKYDSLFDKNAATVASNKLNQESKKECQAPFTLKKVESQNNLPTGTEPPAYFMHGGSDAWVYLKQGQQNILNLTAEELSSITAFTIKGAAPSSDTPLFINVSGESVDLPAYSFDVSLAPYILWNLPDATQVTQRGDSLRGSLLAPKAHLDKTNANIDGTIIVDSGDMKGSEQHYAPFEGVFTPCGDEPTPVEPSIGTFAKVEGADNVNVLPVSGGTVVDTVAYKNLKPETAYTLAGELVHVDAANQVVAKTGITASGTFTTGKAAEGESVVSGSAEVRFDISAEDAAKYAGEKLVVYEKLSLDGEVVANHEDPADVKQSFTVENKPPTTEVVVEKTVTGPKAGEVNKDESAEFEITASWLDKDGEEQFKVIKVKPGQEASVDGLPVGTEITLTESGASTKVKNVKWADIIWSGNGVTDGTGASKSGTITLDGKSTQKIDLENKTSANGLIIIPIPLPGLPTVPGSSTPPGPHVPVTPGQPGQPTKPGTPSEPTKPGTPSDSAQPAPKGSKGSGLANTGADVMLLAGGGLLLLLGGAWLVLRGRKQES